MRLFLVRHAQTAWNVAGRAQGSTDIPLDSHGEWQARALAEALREHRPTAVLSSDLLRCRQTAEAVALESGGTLTLHQNLRERAGGAWEGLPFDEFRHNLRAAQTPDDPFGLDVRPPGGESMRDVWNRLDCVLECLAEHSEPTVVISHGGASALLLAKLLGGNAVTARAFRFGNAAITELSRTLQGLYTLERYNDVAHLEGSTVMAGNMDGTLR